MFDFFQKTHLEKSTKIFDHLKIRKIKNMLHFHKPDILNLLAAEVNEKSKKMIKKSIFILFYLIPAILRYRMRIDFWIIYFRETVDRIILIQDFNRILLKFQKNNKLIFFN